MFLNVKNYEHGLFIALDFYYSPSQLADHTMCPLDEPPDFMPAF
jgi:hypothetical protein